jgi:cytosine/creatinine deaminase
MADDLLVSNVRPYGAEPTDILIRAGHIAAVGMITPTAGVPVLDGKGKLALPGLVEAHKPIWTNSSWICRGIATRWASA